MSEQEYLPFSDDLEGDGSQKFYSSGMYNPAILGLPQSYSGVTKRNQLAWNNKGVSLAYMLVPTLKSAIDVISQNLASVPMVLKDNKGNIAYRSDNSGASEDNFLSAIERSYKYYGLPLFELWAKSILLYGATIVEKVPNRIDEYVGLKWLNPLAVTVDLEVVQDTDEIVIGNRRNHYEQRKFTYTGRFGTATYSEDEILYSRAFNPIDDIRGYSDALSALSKANISMEFESFTLAFYANQGHPGVIISPKDKLMNPKSAQEWQRQWDEKFRGSYQQFKTHINSFPFDVHTFDILDISKPLEVSKDAETKILRALKVPPEMIGDTSENSYQFSKESKNAFMQTVVRPLALSISNCINHSGIIEEFNGDSKLKFAFDFSEYENVAKADLDKQDVLERRVKSGGISIGAYQRALGAEVVDGSDNVFMIPQGFTVVKKEAITNPELLPQPPDKTGADPNSMNQSERVTQSSTGEQESTEFFASKSVVDTNKNEQIKGFNEFYNQDGESVHEETIFSSFGMIPLKYEHINFNIPLESVKTIKSALDTLSEDTEIPEMVINRAKQFTNKNYQITPDTVSRVHNYLKEKTLSEDKLEYEIWGGDTALEWSEQILKQMGQADKLETKKSLTVQELYELAEENDLTIEKALEMFENFSNNDLF